MAKKKFKDLTLRGQKMRIVDDAIKQIKLNIFQPKNGKYLRFMEYVDSDSNLQSLFLNKKPCECCAKGAIFSACVLNVNRVYGRDKFGDNDFQKKKIKKWFNEREANLIEAAFECGVVGNERYSSHLVKESVYGFDPSSEIYGKKLWFERNKHSLREDCIKAIKFGFKYKTPTNRLLAILNNIKQNGSFTP